MKIKRKVFRPSSVAAKTMKMIFEITDEWGVAIPDKAARILAVTLLEIRVQDLIERKFYTCHK